VNVVFPIGLEIVLIDDEQTNSKEFVLKAGRILALAYIFHRGNIVEVQNPK
jgi:hypothetical protein